MSETVIQIIAASVAILIAAALVQRWMIRRGSLRTCPHCRSVIDGAATVCKSCHRDL